MNGKSKELRFSVVTPSYNQGAFIGQTIASVLEQDYANFEHIVIDGGSSDQTLSVLKSHPHLYWVSEPDSGQSQAVNKGFQKASGDVIAWINSDDWYEPGAFAAINDFFVENPDCGVVMGDCRLVNASGEPLEIVVNKARGFTQMRRYWVPRSIPTQPAVFFRRRLLDECGILDESLYYAMDFDLWLRFSRVCRFLHLDKTVANYRFHSLAKGGDRDWSKFMPEWEKVYRRRVGPLSVFRDAVARILYDSAGRFPGVRRVFRH